MLHLHTASPTAGFSVDRLTKASVCFREMLVMGSAGAVGLVVERVCVKTGLPGVAGTGDG